MLYQVTISGHTHTTKANTPYHAVKKAIRALIKQEALTRQPKSDGYGGFQNTEVERLDG